VSESKQMRLRELATVRTQREQDRKQAERDQEFVLEFLANCRSAVDIPELVGGQFFCQHRGRRGFVLWVPEGEHRMRIFVKVAFSATGGQGEQTPVSKVAASESAESKVSEYEWDVALIGKSGYQFDLQSEREGAPVAWRLTANRTEFATRSEVIPIGEVQWNSYSYSGGNRVVFPNQCEDIWQVPRIRAVANQPEAIGLYNLALRGDRDNQEFSIDMRVEVASEGSASVSPDGAASIIFRGHPELLAPYSSDGRFELLSQ